MIAELVDLVASIFEIAGALFMANALLGLIHRPWRDVPRYLASALVNGKHARGVAALGGLSTEDYRKSLRGLAFIALGFLLKFAVIAYEVVSGLLAPASPR